MTSHRTPRAVALDINGTLELDGTALPGALVAVERLRGRPHVYATNTTTRPAAAVEASLADLGFRCEGGSVVSAAAAASSYLRTFTGKGVTRVYFLGAGEPFSDSPHVELVDDPAQADAAVLGGTLSSMRLDDFERFADASARHGLPVVAMHGNCFEARKGRLAIDTGLLLGAIEHITGSSVTIVGKPAPSFFASIAQVLGVPPSSVVFVGDDVSTDAVAAQRAGMTGVLVRTGKYRRGQEHQNPAPDHVIDSIADLPSLLEELSA